MLIHGSLPTKYMVRGMTTVKRKVPVAEHGYAMNNSLPSPTSYLDQIALSNDTGSATSGSGQPDTTAELQLKKLIKQRTVSILKVHRQLSKSSTSLATAINAQTLHPLQPHSPDELKRQVPGCMTIPQSIQKLCTEPLMSHPTSIRSILESARQRQPRQVNKKSSVPTCCIVGCSCKQSQCKGVSFMHLPKTSDNPEKEELRRKLIHAINRNDRFNAEKAYICSRHFTEECLVTHGRGLRIAGGSLPTKFLPAKSIETPKTTPRKKSTIRTPPPIPERVAYNALHEVQKDAMKLPHPWFAIPTTAEVLELGCLDGFALKFKVVINTTLDAAIYVDGKVADSESIEKTRLRTFLRNVAEKRRCRGLVDPALQHLAPLQTLSSKNTILRFFRQLTNLNHDGIHQDSTIRSLNCTLFTKLMPAVCKPCKEVHHTLLQKVKRDKLAASKPLLHSTPLSCISREKLIAEVKSLRLKEKSLKKQVRNLQNKLETQSIMLDQENPHGGISYQEQKLQLQPTLVLQMRCNGSAQGSNTEIPTVMNSPLKKRPRQE